MKSKTKKILLITAVLLIAVCAIAYPNRSKIAGKLGLKGKDHKRVAAQQTAKIEPIAWDESKHGNEAMIEYLHQVYTKINQPGCRFMNTAIAESLLKQPIPNDIDGKFDWYFNVTNQLLNCGRVNDAVTKIHEFENSPDFSKLTNDKLGQWYYSSGLAFLRYGEVQNCIGNHNAESCIWPLSKAAQSTELEGPNKSVAALTKCLQYAPDNLSAMWLMNIAYMQLGQYPDKVPTQWLIPPDSFKSEYPVPKFKNIAINLGVDFPNMCGGVILDDFNNDHLIDIFTCGWGLHEQCYYLINKGDGTFEDVTDKAGLKNYPGGLMIQQVDFNNDGNLDVWISRGAWHSEFGILPSSLLKNNGDGTFTDITYESGLWSCHPSQASTWADFNNDGWLDVFIGNEAAKEGGDKRNNCEMFISDHGKFKNVAKESNTDFNGFVKGVASGDMDNDGDADIYVSVNGGENHLFRNDTKKGSNKFVFEDISKEAGISGPVQSFPCWFFDYNNDGWLDIMNFSYSASVSDNDVPAEYFKKPRVGDQTALYVNNKNGTFTDIGATCGLNRSFLVMGSNYGDFDMDGWIDFYVGSGKPDLRSLIPNRLFKNGEGKQWFDVTTDAGVGVLQKGHEISFADLNNDGYPELYAQMGGAYEASGFYDCLFETPGDSAFHNNWISIDLVGTKTNHCARGARVKVTVTENGQDRDIYDWVSNGSSFGGNSLREEIGLGKATEIKKVEISWPTSGDVQTFNNVAVNQHIKITEGNNQFEVFNLLPFQFNVPDHPMNMHNMMMGNMDMGGKETSMK